MNLAEISSVFDHLDTNNNLHKDYINGSNIMYDFSNEYFPPNKMWIKLPTWEISVKIATFIPIILFGSIGNIMLLNIIIRNRSLKTPTNLLIANMAAADTATILICPIMFMYHDFYQNYKMGAVGCKIEGFLEGVLMITAVLNLCAVSYDRLTAIVLPMESRLTIKGAKIVMICTWLAGIILSLPLAIYRVYVERQFKNFLETYCKENTKILPKYWHVLIAALVWFPLLVMIISYSAIFHKLDHYEKQVLKKEHPLSVSYKKKVAKTLFTVVIVFVILRLPFTVLVFFRYEMQLRNWSTEVSNGFQILWYSSHYLIFLNAAVNPIIYGMNNDNFRRAFHQTPIFSCCCEPKEITKKKKKIIPGPGIAHKDCIVGAKTPCVSNKKLVINAVNTSEKCEQNGAIDAYGNKSTKTTQLNFTTKSNDDDGGNDGHKMTIEMMKFETEKINFNNKNNVNVHGNGFI